MLCGVFCSSRVLWRGLGCRTRPRGVLLELAVSGVLCCRVLWRPVRLVFRVVLVDSARGRNVSCLLDQRVCVSRRCRRAGAGVARMSLRFWCVVCASWCGPRAEAW